MSKAVSEKMSGKIRKKRKTVKAHKGSDVWERRLDTPSLTNSSTHLPLHSPTHPSTHTSTHPPFSEIAIKVEHVSKKYCKSLKRSMLYGVEDIGRNMIGLNSRSDRLRKNEFWAIDDISFNVKRGEALGIIGPNGAGKTTLLKMLNGIFWPDKGRITVRGRIGALIEVGAGFHPMLTGRENIYLHGAILGMRKKDINRKLNSIIEFSELSSFIDIPIKKYSSGMLVRLGFSIAIHAEFDILLIDEILAVGDMKFQRKCILRIKELLSRNKLLLFVSHNLVHVRALCQKTLFLEQGIPKLFNNTIEAIEFYENDVRRKSQKKEIFSNIEGSREALIKKVIIWDESTNSSNLFSLGDKMLIKIDFFAKQKIKRPVFSIGIFRNDGLCCCVADTRTDNFYIEEIQGEGSVCVKTSNLNLLPGEYWIDAAIWDRDISVPYDYKNQISFFTIESISTYNIVGIIKIKTEWELKININ